MHNIQLYKLKSLYTKRHYGNQGVVAVVPAFLKWQGLRKKKLDTRSDTHCVKIGVQLWWR